MVNFTIALALLAIVCFVLYVASDVKGKSAIVRRELAKFQWKFLRVYLLAVAGDWLQGPHVYALYQSYGMQKHEIELLFAVGFGSSMLFGTVVGAFADTVGRKKICILYGILYALSCITKHSDDFWILLIGRFLGGIATSLLYSAFESWLVCESFKQGFEEPHLKAVFANVVLGNSVVAIVSGIIAQYAADFVGLVGPFDVSAVVLIIMVILVATTWSENYGNEHWSIRDSLTQAVKIIANNKRVAYLGVVQSLFEGSMYTFVLEWTPVLTAAVLNSPDPKDRFVPHGLIFASFMICIMIGSSIFKLMANIWRPEFFMKYIFLCAAVSLTFPIFLCLNSLFVFTGFAIFEICVGVFWPASGFMRSVHVPEKARSTVMNIFRIPLNLVVVVILLFDLPITWIFVGCFLFLMLAGIFQHLFHLSIVSSIAGDEKAAPI
ncbi:Major facilitator superfamily domain-containing protein 5 [Trichinella pseudospiralis]|uniref:Major facilitator superfamily domain-containing protein 5 n=2 Tax=Trichinella pseudospiralis TaxID=6337 RepID=A0A0V1IYN7_TRIPS|nr:Major facilitator superfamily domain-containing protein 5 [Trichinella pseudospiralis]KRZ27835.1 Major facilitator superfamily domain-containing protein 5 [Trichinella pseudospiralis]